MALSRPCGLAGRSCDVLDVDYPGDFTPFWDVEQISALDSWLKGLPKPIGIMACNDLRAHQIISAAHASEILVPEEVAVLGANNETIRCELAYPPLSSVIPNAFQSGYKAAETLAALMAKKPPASQDLRIESLGVATSPLYRCVGDRRQKCGHGVEFHPVKIPVLALPWDEVVRNAYTSRSQLEKKFRKHAWPLPSSGNPPEFRSRKIKAAAARIRLPLETHRRNCRF